MTDKNPTTTDPDLQTVQLQTPLERPAGAITRVTLRKPHAGALRGLSLAELLQLKVDALQAVLPRISEPMLLKTEVSTMDPADLLALGTVVMGFLLPRDQLEPLQST